MTPDEEEYFNDAAEQEDFGPMSSCHRLSPAVGNEMVWLERYHCTVVVRWTEPETRADAATDVAGVVTSVTWPTEADAIRGMVTRFAEFLHDGWTRMEDD